MTKYISQIFDQGCCVNTVDAQFATITECRKYAEEYGTTATSCAILRATDGKLVAMHMRDTNGDGTRWFKA